MSLTLRSTSGIRDFVPVFVQEGDILNSCCNLQLYGQIIVSEFGHKLTFCCLLLKVSCTLYENIVVKIVILQSFSCNYTFKLCWTIK